MALPALKQPDQAEIYQPAQPQSHQANTNDHEGVETEENRDDEENNTSAATPPLPTNVDGTKAASVSDGEAEPMQLCLLDSAGNKVKISSIEQFKAAVSLLENSNDLDPMYTYSTDGLLDQQQQQQQNENEAVNNFSTRTNTSPRAFLDEVKRFELFRSVIQHEDDLLNQRVSWIILAQSFLMAAFITNTSDDTDALKYITAIVGLLTVVVTMPAILAAGRNIELQQRVYFAYISSEERCRELHGHGRNILQSTREKGNATNLKDEYRERVMNGHIFPNMAFRGRGSVPILFTVVALAIVQVVGWCFLLVALGKGCNN
ncbi:hypothetical protein ACHAXR_011080 [Thalassiosira sp. AJA248-18]